MRRALRGAAWILLGMPLTLVGCGTDGTDPGSGGEPGPGAGDGGTDDPPARELVLEISTEGGFRQVGADVRSLPTAVVLGDGTVFAPAPHVQVFPGPAVLPVATGRLEPGAVDELVAAARDAGLTDATPPEVGQPPIADAATTVITVVADGEEHVTEIYALGAVDAPDGLGADPPGLTDEQRSARSAISELVDLVSGRVTDAADRQYRPERYRLLPLPPEQVLGATEGEERDWPLGVPLTPGECVALTGSAAREFRELVPEVTEATRWRTGSGQVLALVARALLPHEPDCPSG